MEIDNSAWGGQVSSLSPETRKEMQDFLKATESVALWLTRKLKNRTEWGAFSEAYIGEPAVVYFTHRLTVTYMSGQWKRHKNEKLLTFLIRMVKSDMSHHIKKWKTQGEAEVQEMCSLNDVQRAYAEMVTSEVMKELNDGDELRSVSLSIAEKAAEDDENLTKYVHAMIKKNNYREISKLMHLRMKEVLELETRLLEKVKPYAIGLSIKKETDC